MKLDTLPFVLKLVKSKFSVAAFRTLDDAEEYALARSKKYPSVIYYLTDADGIGLGYSWQNGRQTTRAGKMLD